MLINYQIFSFNIKIERDIYFQSFPSFIFRSVIGKELRKLSCLFRKKSCNDCDLKFQCAYSRIFESPIEKNTIVLKGRNYASHPFVISTNKKEGEKITEISLNLTLIGNSLDYFSYIFYSIQKAGESGLFGEKIPYKVKEVLVDKKNIINQGGSINTNFKSKVWKLDLDKKRVAKKHFIINFKSPLRLKIRGRYRDAFTYSDFLQSVYRRLEILSLLYGKNDQFKYNFLDLSLNKDETSNLVWKDLKRYSARQGSVIKLGGVVGIMELKGEFTPFELSLLKGAELFHAGKNPSFGLGNIKLLEIKE